MRQEKKVSFQINERKNFYNITNTNKLEQIFSTLWINKMSFTQVTRVSIKTVSSQLLLFPMSKSRDPAPDAPAVPPPMIFVQMKVVWPPPDLLPALSKWWWPEFRLRHSRWLNESAIKGCTLLVIIMLVRWGNISWQSVTRYIA